MKKLLFVFGTRPEAIKMCPLVNEFGRRAGFDVRVCVTGQHEELLRDAMGAFGVAPNYDLGIMRPEQTLENITARVLDGMGGVFASYRPDLVFVHGDTTTSFSAALYCFYHRVPVAHVEAGLRTHDIFSPFPEEYNRRAIGLSAEYHFAPTEDARDNLLAEGVPEARVWVTGNTVVDALKATVCDGYKSRITECVGGGRLILLTAHRRENHGEPLQRMLSATRRVAEEHGDVTLVYPVHPNPAVSIAAHELLGGLKNVILSEPLGVYDFHNLLARAYLVLTDSGGVQEEASALGVPALVMREKTERPEGIAAGTLRLVGTEEEGIVSACRELLADAGAREKMARAENPFGDGRACSRIADIICEKAREGSF